MILRSKITARLIGDIGDILLVLNQNEDYYQGTRYTVLSRLGLVFDIWSEYVEVLSC